MEAEFEREDIMDEDVIGGTEVTLQTYETGEGEDVLDLTEGAAEEYEEYEDVPAKEARLLINIIKNED